MSFNCRFVLDPLLISGTQLMVGDMHADHLQHVLRGSNGLQVSRHTAEPATADCHLLQCTVPHRHGLPLLLQELEGLAFSWSRPEPRYAASGQV